VKRFVQGDRPLCTSEISEALEIPARFVRQLLDELINAKLVVETARNGNETAFQPGQATEKVTIQFALEAYERQGLNPTRLASVEDERIAFYVRAIAVEMANSPKNVLLKEI
jgi:DNA-binding IscR family transcriptional regulator